MSWIVAGSLTKAALGNESATGVGTPAFEVTQNIPSVPAALNTDQPAGSAGGVTPSKFSLNVPPHAVGVGVGVMVGAIVAVAVGVNVAVAVAVGDAVAVGVGVNVAVAVGVGEGVGVAAIAPAISSAPISGLAPLGRPSPSISSNTLVIVTPALMFGDVTGVICRLAVFDTYSGSAWIELAS